MTEEASGGPVGVLPVAGRLAGVDKLRGAAVLLMVVDHALVAFPAGVVGQAVRMTATRASLPLFCVVVGAFGSSSVRWGRVATVAAVGAAVSAPGAVLGLGRPDVLLVLAAVLAVAPLAASNPLPWLVVAVLQPVTWPVPGTGYQPGTVLALVIVGGLVGRWSLNEMGQGLPGWVGGLGRYPLSIYFVHVAGLAGLRLGLGG